MQHYIEQGCPPPQRVWTGADYDALAKLIDAQKLPLPRVSDPALAPIFHRMVDQQNLQALRQTGQNIFQTANKIGATLPPLILHYRTAIEGGQKLDDEIAALTGFLLETASTSFAYMPEASELDEKAPANVREKQSDMHDKMGDSLLQVFNSVMRSIEKSETPDSSRIIYANAIGQSLPLVRAALPRAPLLRLKSRLKTCRGQKNSPALDAALNRAIAATEGEVILNS